MTDQPSPPVVVPAPAVSPTGEAILPAKYVPAAMGLASLPGAVAAALAAGGAYPKVQLWLGIASGVLWAVLGVVSPGLRKLPPQAGFVRLRAAWALSATFLCLAGCAHFKLWWHDTIDCEKHDAPELLQVLPQVASALAAQDYFGAVNDLVKQQGEVVQCVVAMLSAVPPEQPVTSLGALAQSLAAVNPAQSSNASQLVASWGKTLVNVAPAK